MTILNDAWTVNLHFKEDTSMDNDTRDFLIKKLSADLKQSEANVDSYTNMMAAYGQRLNDAISTRKSLRKAIEKLLKMDECDDDDSECGCDCA